MHNNNSCYPYHQQPLVSFEGEAPHTQVQQPTYQTRPDTYYQNNLNLHRMKAETDINKHLMMQNIDAESIEWRQKSKADIQIKKDMLSETVEITSEGGLIIKQEYLLERPKEYSFANFRLDGCPTRFVCNRSNGSVIFLPVVVEKFKEQNLYLDLEVDDVNYYWRKFRNAGLTLKKHKRGRKDMIFDVIQALSSPDIAKTVELPLNRGFYMTDDGCWCYADKESVIWKEVKEYAK